MRASLLLMRESATRKPSAILSSRSAAKCLRNTLQPALVLIGSHRVPGCYRGIGLESAGRGHNGRTDPNHAKTCQRQPEAAPQALLRREKAEVGMEILGRGHGDTPTNLSPIPPGPKLGQLCRLVELVAAAPSKKASSVNIARLACRVCQDVASPGSVLPKRRSGARSSR